MSEGTTAEAADEVIGRADFWYTEDEFARAKHGERAAGGRSLDGWVVRLPLLVLGHFLLLFGLVFVGTWLGSADFRQGEKRTGAMLVALGFLVAGGWIVDRWLYGRGRRLRKRFREFPLAGSKVELTFTTDGLLTRSPKSEGRTRWECFTGVFESRDGFVVRLPPGSGIWIPKRALQSPFDAPAVAAFLRSKVGKVRTTPAPAAPESESPVGDGPMIVTDPARVVGSASYRFTADEFAAASRALSIATLPWHRSRIWALLYFGLWHAALIGALAIVAAWAVGLDGQEGRFSKTTALFAAFASLLFARILWAGLYGFDRRLRAAYPRFLAAGDDYVVAFTPDRYHVHTRLGDTSETWDILRSVVELRDGFVLLIKLQAGGFWVPDHALHPPFDHQAAAAFLRSKVGQYRVVDRAAGKTSDLPQG